MVKGRWKDVEGDKLLTRDTVVILGASFFYLASTMLVNPLIAGFAASMGAVAAVMGLVGSLMNVCSLAVRPIAGNLAERFPKRRLAALGACVMCLTAFGQAAAPSIEVLAAMRLVNGAGYSLCSVCMATWLAEKLPSSRVGQGMGLFGLMNALGMAIGPAAGIAVSDALGYRAAIALAGVLAVASVAGILAVPAGARTETGAPGPEDSGSAEPKPAFRLLDRRAVPAALTVMMFTIPYMACQSFLVSYVEARGLPVAAGAFFTIYAAVLMGLRLVLGRAFDTVGFGRFLAASSASALLSLALLAVMRDNLTMALAAAAMAGGYGVMCSVCQSTAVRAVGPEHAGLANSTYYMGFDIGLSVGTLVGGMLFGSVELTWFFPALMCAIPLAWVVFALRGRIGGPARDRIQAR